MIIIYFRSRGKTVNEFAVDSFCLVGGAFLFEQRVLGESIFLYLFIYACTLTPTLSLKGEGVLKYLMFKFRSHS